MRRIKRFQWILGVALTTAVFSASVSAQEGETLVISGSLGMDGTWGAPGADLAQVYARGENHGWTLTLHDVSYSHNVYYYDDWNNNYYVDYTTGVHATSFDLEFFGPDAALLNEAVADPLTGGRLSGGAFVQLWNGYYYDTTYSDNDVFYSSFNIGLQPQDPNAGVSFYVGGVWNYVEQFAADAGGYPIVESQLLGSDEILIDDLRPGAYGGLRSYQDQVVIGSSEPPVLPPPPMKLRIADGSVIEGDQGTTRLDLAVTLTRASSEVVSVKYETVNGTAVASSDYTAASGTLTFQPGQTSRTISLYVKGDRTKESDETFSVRLSEPVGAVFDDLLGAVTIRNDDGAKKSGR